MPIWSSRTTASDHPAKYSSSGKKWPLTALALQTHMERWRNSPEIKRLAETRAGIQTMMQRVQFSPEFKQLTQTIATMQAARIALPRILLEMPDQPNRRALIPSVRYPNTKR